MDFNLIASSPRNREREAALELISLLREFGDDSPSVRRTEVSGLMVVKSKVDPFSFISFVKEKVRNEPWAVMNVMKLVPIEVVVDTDVGSISEAVKRLSGKIGEGESFRITLRKRHTSISSRDVIDAAAGVIDRKVDLEHPDRVVLIEIIGGLTGVSVIRPEDEFSLVREKRG